jgi:O-antigen/teichoic acid export membrane protein
MPFPVRFPSSLPAFWSRVATVLGGTIIAQLIPIAILPLLTRLIGPEDLGLYFLWSGVASVLTVLASAKLDMAIFTAQIEEVIDDLLRLIAFIAIGIAILTLIVLKAILPWSGFVIENRAIQEFSGPLALFALAMAIYQGLLAVLTYRAAFKRLVWAGILLAGSIALLQLLAGWAGLGVRGLIYSRLLMTGVVGVAVMHWAEISPLHLVRGFSFPRLRGVLVANYRFPLYSMPGNFVNSLAAQLPLFIIIARFGPAAVAFYALTLKVLAGPISLLANSVLTVFKEQAGRDFREQGNCRDAYRYAFKSLVALAILPALILGGFGEQIFRITFGPGWGVAGHYAQMLAPLFFMRFIASPLSYTLYLSQRQLQALIWQTGVLAMTWAVFSLTNNLETAITVYSLAYSTMYLLYIFISYQAACGTRKRECPVRTPAPDHPR